MAARLSNIWDRYAFPDEYPAKEQVWAQESERRRVADRTDLYLEQSGAGLKISRFTNSRDDSPLGRKDKKDRALDDMMLLAVGSPEYQAAYDNELSFTIGGEEFEITQGELFERAKVRAEELQRQIEAAKRRGVSAEEIARLEATRNQVIIVRDNTDPALDMMDEDRHRRVQAALNHPDQDPALTQPQKDEAAFGRDPGNDKMQAADMSSGTDQDATENAVIEGWGQGKSRTATFAGTIDGPADNETAARLTEKFAAVADNAPPDDRPEEDKPAPAAQNRVTGLGV